MPLVGRGRLLDVLGATVVRGQIPLVTKGKKASEYRKNRTSLSRIHVLTFNVSEFPREIAILQRHLPRKQM